MNTCSLTGKECRTEYFETVTGEEWVKCADCGEQYMARYEDHNGC